MALRLFWRLAPLSAALLFVWVWLYDVGGLRTWFAGLLTAQLLSSIGGS